MPTSIREIYSRYLRREATLADLRHWLAGNQWELPAEEQELADEADFALADFDNGYGQEGYLRARLREALQRHTVTTALTVMLMDYVPDQSFKSRQSSRTASTTAPLVLVDIGAAA